MGNLSSRGSHRNTSSVTPVPESFVTKNDSSSRRNQNANHTNHHHDNTTNINTTHNTNNTSSPMTNNMTLNMNVNVNFSSDSDHDQYIPDENLGLQMDRRASVTPSGAGSASRSASLPVVFHNNYHQNVNNHNNGGLTPLTYSPTSDHFVPSPRPHGHPSHNPSPRVSASSPSSPTPLTPSRRSSLAPSLNLLMNSSLPHAHTINNNNNNNQIHNPDMGMGMGMGESLFSKRSSASLASSSSSASSPSPTGSPYTKFHPTNPLAIPSPPQQNSQSRPLQPLSANLSQSAPSNVSPPPFHLSPSTSPRQSVPSSPSSSQPHPILSNVNFYVELKASLLGQYLSDTETEFLSSKMTVQRYPNNTILYSQGDVIDSLFIVRSGKIALGVHCAPSPSQSHHENSTTVVPSSSSSSAAPSMDFSSLPPIPTSTPRFINTNSTTSNNNNPTANINVNVNSSLYTPRLSSSTPTPKSARSSVSSFPPSSMGTSMKILSLKTVGDFIGTEPIIQNFVPTQSANPNVSNINKDVQSRSGRNSSRNGSKSSSPASTPSNSPRPSSAKNVPIASSTVPLFTSHRCVSPSTAISMKESVCLIIKYSHLADFFSQFPHLQTTILNCLGAGLPMILYDNPVLSTMLPSLLSPSAPFSTSSSSSSIASILPLPLASPSSSSSSSSSPSPSPSLSLFSSSSTSTPSSSSLLLLCSLFHHIQLDSHVSPWLKYQKIEGDDLSPLMVLVDGEMTQVDINGREEKIYSVNDTPTFLSPVPSSYRFLGLPSFLYEYPRPSSLSTLSSCVVLVLPRWSLKAIGEIHSGIMEEMMNQLVETGNQSSTSHTNMNNMAMNSSNIISPISHIASSPTDSLSLLFGLSYFPSSFLPYAREHADAAEFVTSAFQWEMKATAYVNSKGGNGNGNGNGHPLSMTMQSAGGNNQSNNGTPRMSPIPSSPSKSSSMSNIQGHMTHSYVPPLMFPNSQSHHNIHQHLSHLSHNLHGLSPLLIEEAESLFTQYLSDSSTTVVPIEQNTKTHLSLIMGNGMISPSFFRDGIEEAVRGMRERIIHFIKGNEWREIFSSAVSHRPFGNGFAPSSSPSPVPGFNRSPYPQLNSHRFPVVPPSSSPKSNSRGRSISHVSQMSQMALAEESLVQGQRDRERDKGDKLSEREMSRSNNNHSNYNNKFNPISNVSSSSTSMSAPSSALSTPIKSSPQSFVFPTSSPLQRTSSHNKTFIAISAQAHSSSSTPRNLAQQFGHFGNNNGGGRPHPHSPLSHSIPSLPEIDDHDISGQMGRNSRGRSGSQANSQESEQ